MTDIVEQLLSDYWDAAYQEGKDGRIHDTEDVKAQRALSAIRAEFRVLYQRVAKLERTIEYFKSITTGYEHERIAELVKEETK